MRALIGSVLVATVRRFYYPNNAGQPTRRDPTHGRIDRDIQWKVQDWGPVALGQRVAMECNLQTIRDRQVG